MGACARSSEYASTTGPELFRVLIRPVLRPLLLLLPVCAFENIEQPQLPQLRCLILQEVLERQQPLF